ncbi:MAG: HlyD family secretion protein [Roseiarcus sp.]
MSRQVVILALIGLVLVVVVAITLRPAPPAPVQWQGYAEADFVEVGPTQQGLLTVLSVERGDRVVKGQPLFEQDETADRAGVDQAARLLRQAEAQAQNLQQPSKPTEIAQAEANLTDAVASRDRVAADLERNRKLLATGAATAQIVDQEQADFRSAEAKIAAMRAALDNLRAAIGRPLEIEAANEGVDAARAAVAEAKWRLDQRRVAAPVSGVVADVLARPGETLAAGAPAVSLLPPANIFVRFFISEAGLAHARVGDRVALACDGCRPDLSGRVSFIAPEAEYTPPFIYSETTKTKFVYLAEARLDPDFVGALEPGEPVTVKPLEAAP